MQFGKALVSDHTAIGTENIAVAEQRSRMANNRLKSKLRLHENDVELCLMLKSRDA